MQDIEVIARAVVMQGDKILLAQAKGSLNMFLPGGHIEKGEFAREALRRELAEELGLDADIGEYIGTLEYIYSKKNGEQIQEVNIIFKVSIASQEVKSREKLLEFKWVYASELESVNLLPEPLPVLLHGWLQTLEPFYECMVESNQMKNKLSTI